MQTRAIKKGDLCKEIYSAGGRRKSSTLERGTRAHFKWCQMWGGSVPFVHLPHIRTPCQGGPGGAWRSRLWVRAVGEVMQSICTERVRLSTYVWHGGGGAQQNRCCCCFLMLEKRGYHVAKNENEWDFFFPNFWTANKHIIQSHWVLWNGLLP